jgi:large subunit ribosomal protein L9
MKVILKQDIRALGRKGDIKEVADGYGRNYLLPKNMALEATPANIKLLNDQKASIVHREFQDEAEAKELAAKLKDLVITFKAKTGEGGRLFGSITAKDVAEEIQKKTHYELDKRKLVIDDAIKNTGDHPVKIHLYKEISATITVKVVPE